LIFGIYGIVNTYLYFLVIQKLLNVHVGVISTALIERIHQSEHTFYYQTLHVDFSNTLGEFYGLDMQVDEDPAKINLDMSQETYDMIHAIDENELDRMINQIIATSSSFKKFFEAVQLSVVDYLTSKVDKKVEKKDEKFFSFKRGFIFYWKSNVFLLFSFFLLNKNSWAPDGDSYVWILGIQVEALLMILSFIACLRPRV
jgi:hypothetical protein